MIKTWSTPPLANNSTSSPSSPHEARRSVRVIKQRVSGSKRSAAEEDWLALEEPLAITLVLAQEKPQREKPFLVTMRTPGEERALIHGLLFAEGLIENADQVKAIDLIQPEPSKPATKAIVTLGGINPVTPSPRNTPAQSSCGVCGTTALDSLSLSGEQTLTDPMTLPSTQIHRLPASMNGSQKTFQQTGGLHAASLFDTSGECLYVREDIGRHNAVDKVIGEALLARRIPGVGLVLFVSGRMSYDIMQKALHARIPVVAGVGAPSSLAVAIANDYNITLLGFVRDNSYNIYSAPQRILDSH